MRNYRVVYGRVDVSNEREYLFSISREILDRVIFCSIYRINHSYYIEILFNNRDRDDENIYAYFDNDTLYLWGNGIANLQYVLPVVDEANNEIEFVFYFSYVDFLSIALPLN